MRRITNLPLVRATDEMLRAYREKNPDEYRRAIERWRALNEDEQERVSAEGNDDQVKER